MINVNILPKSMAIDNNRVSIYFVMTRNRTQQIKENMCVNILPKSMAIDNNRVSIYFVMTRNRTQQIKENM